MSYYDFTTLVSYIKSRLNNCEIYWVFYVKVTYASISYPWSLICKIKNLLGGLLLEGGGGLLLQKLQYFYSCAKVTLKYASILPFEFLKKIIQYKTIHNLNNILDQ